MKSKPRKKKKYRWNCAWMNNYTSWADATPCPCYGRKWHSDKYSAQKAAYKHAKETGHPVFVYGEFR